MYFKHLTWHVVPVNSDLLLVQRSVFMLNVDPINRHATSLHSLDSLLSGSWKRSEGWDSSNLTSERSGYTRLRAGDLGRYRGRPKIEKPPKGEVILGSTWNRQKAHKGYSFVVFTLFGFRVLLSILRLDITLSWLNSGTFRLLKDLN